mmetsp:Transcript_16008/g.33844  ORF Transcript_16008/g.33844 Transcript_16008/m.33844 type:complete len:724 (-) Transcript_16008:231-2402(-)
MSAPRAKDNRDNVDEEAALCPPAEISIHRTHHHHSTAAGFNDDENTVPSELSTLIAPSTLTPNYNGRGTLDFPDEYGEYSHDSMTAIRPHKAFQLAALIGFLSIGALFGADGVYHAISVTPSSSNDVSQVSSAMNRGALDFWSGRRSSSVIESNDSGADATQEGQGQAEKTTKKTKAKKAKTRKEADMRNSDARAAIEKGEDENEDEDELIVATRRVIHDGLKLVPHYDTTGGDWNNNSSNNSQEIVSIPEAHERCPHVIDTFARQNEGVTNIDFLREKYHAQSADPNIFYRATALLFWKDFGAGAWGREQNRSIDFAALVNRKDARYEDGTPLSPMSTWTWITGDQHLSNFGAWRNRGGDVVFSVNDFDEAAIYDFHIDVLRIAVSICSHGFTNGLDEDQVREALEAFTYTYVKTAIDYVGGDTALIYELNPDTATGALRDFLWDVRENKSRKRLLDKFTQVEGDGVRRFVRNDHTRLQDVHPDVEKRIREQITSTRYGASMMKMGWKVRGWDDDFFTVLDVARRLGSGIGSYGVDRFYVMLKGEDTLLDEEEEGTSVILDVKFEPVSAVTTVLKEVDPDTKAWYDARFRHEADRTAQAQKKLTSYTDPYVGYMDLDGDPSTSYNVRQRSPYKSSFDLDTLTNHREFNEFMEQIAVDTATAHVRGTVAKSPGQFKHVIKLLLAGERNRRRWSDLVAKIAFSYRNQVLLDFECFKQYVQENFS